MLDLAFVRAQFPALETPWALLDNAGGSVPCRQVIERLAAHLERTPVQLGASYSLSREAAAAVDAGRRSAASLVGAEPGELVLGTNSTTLVQILAGALRPLWAEGDEIVVTNLDHETNVGPWRALERTGIVVREWRFRPETAELHLEDLEPLLGERTRLVAFTHCSNVVGTIHDVGAFARRVREAGALSCVDGVALAPHRRVDVKALDVDFYFASLYKVYGPHIALLYGRRELLRAARPTNHFFIAADAGPARYEPGNVNYELAASLTGVLEYLEALGERHGIRNGLDLAKSFELIAAQEMELVRPLLSFLDEHPRVSLIGRAAADTSTRVPTIAFTVEGRKSSEIPPRLDEKKLATRFGHFYAYRPIRDLGLLERDGVVRVSLLHYNTPAEVERLLAALDDVL